MRVPPIGRDGIETFQRERAFDDLAGLGERGHRAGREHLHRDVAERGRLDRTGEDGPAGGIGRELIQQPVARSAADDPDLV